MPQKKLHIIFAETELEHGEAAELKPGSIIKLNKFPGDPLDIFFDNRLFARGEVMVMDGKFVMRIVQLPPEKSENQEEKGRRRPNTKTHADKVSEACEIEQVLEKADFYQKAACISSDAPVYPENGQAQLRSYDFEFPVTLSRKQHALLTTIYSEFARLESIRLDSLS